MYRLGYINRNMVTVKRVRLRQNTRHDEYSWDRFKKSLSQISRRLKSSGDGMYRKKLLRMMALTTYFKIMEIGEEATFLNNYLAIIF